MALTSSAIANACRAVLFRAIGAAINPATFLDAVTDDSALTMSAGRRHRVDRAFETVEGVGPPLVHDLESLVVFVAAYLTLRHSCSPQ